MIISGLPKALRESLPFAHKQQKDTDWNRRIFLEGVFLHLNTGATLASTDGKRLRKIVLNTNTYEETKAIIPQDVIKAIQKFSGNVGLEISDDTITITDDSGQTATGGLIPGDYPNYESVIAPTADYTCVVKVDRIVLLTALKMVTPPDTKFKDGKEYPVEIDLWDERMFLCVRPGLSRYSAWEGDIYRYSLPVISDSWNHYMIDMRFLIDSLKNTDDDMATISFGEFTNGPSPVRIEYANKVDLIMPMRF